MKLYRYETVLELSTAGYVIAPDEESARADAEELSDESDRGIWDSDFGPDTRLTEVDPSILTSRDYIWAGGEKGRDVTVAQAIEILSAPPERLPECPGQEAFDV